MFRRRLRNFLRDRSYSSQRIPVRNIVCLHEQQVGTAYFSFCHTTRAHLTSLLLVIAFCGLFLSDVMTEEHYQNEEKTMRSTEPSPSSTSAFSMKDITSEFARVCSIDFPCCEGVEVQYGICREPLSISIEIITRTGKIPQPLSALIEVLITCSFPVLLKLKALLLFFLGQKQRTPCWNVRETHDPNYLTPQCFTLGSGDLIVRAEDECTAGPLAGAGDQATHCVTSLHGNFNGCDVHSANHVVGKVSACKT